MKEYPLLFSAEMVRALLEDRKTRTMRPITARRSTVKSYGVIKKSLLWTGLVWDERVYVDKGLQKWQYLHVPYVHPEDGDNGQVYRVRSRYEIGDQFWGKETWATDAKFDDLSSSGIIKEAGCHLWFKADTIQDEYYKRGRWRSSMFMPRWASRIIREITGVKAQRPQDITEAEAKAEGVDPNKPWGFFDGYLNAFGWLWDFIYAKKGQGWDTNLWCWVYEFRMIN